MSDPLNGGFQCHDKQKDEDFFLPYEESEEIIGTYQEDLEEVLNYWKLRCLRTPKP